MAKIKITQDGQPCRVCGVPVRRRMPHTELRKAQRYYFEYYFECPSCKARYMVEAVKRSVGAVPGRQERRSVREAGEIPLRSRAPLSSH